MLRAAPRAVRTQQALRSAMSPAKKLSTSAPRRTPPKVSPEYVEDPTATPMLRYQKSLPRLPVPTLSSTAAKYLETVKPLVTPAEYKTTEEAVNTFITSDQGKELQRRLLERAGQAGRQSWLSEWWNDVAYMGYRDPVVVFVSYFYIHLDDPAIKTQAARAASLLKALLTFRVLVETGKLEPELARTTPLDMSSYYWLFNSSRYPTKPSDTAKKFDPATNNHVVFVRKNKFYEVPVIADGKPLSTKELEAQINKVIALAGSDSAPAVGALTSENRDTWTDARQTLINASPINAKSLERIESAIVVIALDDYSPITREDVSHACWVGDGKNRFYDKHQIIVFENGKSGFLGEHSCMDGTPTLRMTEFMMGSLAKGKIDHGSEFRSNLTEPVELKFQVDEPTKKAIAVAESNFKTLIDKHDLQVLHYEGYGKDKIKKFKASPDAWAQLVKQLAFHKMANRPGVTYESAQTRKYQLGRTEVIRAASNESKAWAEAMLDVNQTDATRAALFRRAVGRHLQYAAWAADGQGVDRHLFGLKKLLKPDEPVPSVYTDPSFSKSNHWELSTSNLSSSWLDGWGYGEVVEDGYGLSYSIDDHYIRWTITTMNRDKSNSATALKHYLAEAATQTMRMMERAAKEEHAAAAAPKPKL